MPITAAQQRKILKDTLNLYYPRLTQDEKVALNDIYRNEFDRLTEALAATQKEAEAIKVKAIKGAEEEVKKTVMAWAEAGDLEFIIVVVGTERPVPRIILEEVLRRTEWIPIISKVVICSLQGLGAAAANWARRNEIEVEFLRWNRVVDNEDGIRDSLLGRCHGVVAIVDNHTPLGVRPFVKSAKALKLRTFLIDRTKVVIRKPRKSRAKGKRHAQ